MNMEDDNVSLGKKPIRIAMIVTRNRSPRVYCEDGKNLISLSLTFSQSNHSIKA